MARVQNEGLLVVSNTLIPVSLASANSAEGASNLTVAWQHVAHPAERRFGSAKITKHQVLIITQAKQSLRRVRIQFLRNVQSSFSRITASGGGVVAQEINKRMRTRKLRPSKHKIRVKLDCLLKKSHGFQ